MSTGLSDSNIELAENFISCNPVKTHGLGLSISDMEYGIECYKKILSLLPTTYILFGSNAYGMTSYGLYKSRSNQIYVIEAFCNNIVGYYNPESCGLIRVME